MEGLAAPAGGGVGAAFHDGLQLLPADRIALLRGHRLGPVRIAVGICNHGLAGENCGVQIVDLVHLVVQQVALDARLLLLQLADDALQALPDYLFIGAGPAQCMGVVGLVEDEALGGILLVAVDIIQPLKILFFKIFGNCFNTHFMKVCILFYLI